jgi:MFS transporter, DHA1 family, inner membrane transport protein
MKLFSKFSKAEALLILLLACIQFTHIVDFMILMPLGPQITRLLNISQQQFSYLVSSYTLAAGLSGFMSSFFVDFFDRKKVLILFFIGFTIGTFACGLVDSYYTFLFARCLTGVFGGVLSSIILSIVSDNFEYQRRGLAVGTVMGAFALASVFGVPFGLYIANLFQWQAPFIILGGICIIIFILCSVFIPKQNLHLIKGQIRDPLQTLKMIFESKNQRLALILIFFLVMGQFSVIPFISMSFVFNAKLPETSLPLIYLFGGLCSLIAAPIVGRLSDIYTKTKVFSTSVLISIIPVYLITNLGPSSTIVILFISSSFFIAMSGRMVPAMALITSTAPPNKRAGFLSIVSAVQQLSAASAAWIAGQIMSMSSSQALTLGEGNHLAELGKNLDLVNKPLDTYYLVGYVAILASIITFVLAFKVKPEFID